MRSTRISNGVEYHYGGMQSIGAGAIGMSGYVMAERRCAARRLRPREPIEKSGGASVAVNRGCHVMVELELFADAFGIGAACSSAGFLLGGSRLW